MAEAFVCWRPYHILNILNFIDNKMASDTSIGCYDLYVIDENTMKSYIDKMINLGYFRNVILIKPRCKVNSITDKLLNLYYYFSPDAMLKKMLPSQVNKQIKGYTTIYTFGLTPFFIYLALSNVNARKVMLDDGLGCYLNDPRKLELTFKHLIIAKFFNKGPYTIVFERQYLNCLEVSINKAKYKFYQMPSLEKKTLQLAESVFGFKNDVNYNNVDVVFLGNDYTKDKDLLSIISHQVPKSMYRKHPMQEIDDLNISNIHIDQGENFWELICNRYVMDRTILVSEFSNAQFTPFFLYRKRPTIILTYKILGNISNTVTSEIENFIARFEKVSETHLYIPETIEEFDQIIRKLVTKNEKQN